MNPTRRELIASLPALLIPAALGAGTAASATPTANDLPSATYPFAQLTARKAEAAEFRDVLKGKLATGEAIEVHQTTLLPAAMPHPPHRHEHSEMWLIREGTVELTIEGKTTQMGPGSVGFVRSNELHGIKNAGAGPATYFVVAVGPGSA